MHHVPRNACIKSYNMGNTSTVSDILSHLRLNLLSDNSETKSEEPFRSELYSSDQMDRHGKVLAQSHQLQQHRSADKLLKQFTELQIVKETTGGQRYRRFEYLPYLALFEPEGISAKGK